MSDKKKPDGSAVDEKVIGAMLTAIVDAFDEELFATPEADLHNRWHFRWDNDASVRYNLYEFSDQLESLKGDCERWEERHNGSCCVVERVRDKYLMPKISQFLADLKAHT